MPGSKAVAGASVLTRSVTMTIINPWAWTTGAAALAGVAVAVAARAAIYAAEEINNLAKLNGGGVHGDTTSIGPYQVTTAEALQQGLDTAHIAMVDQWLASDMHKYYTFRVNPSKLDKSFSKIRDNRLTGGGFAQTTYGNNLVPYAYQGSTGSMLPAVSRMPQLSPAWHYLALFEKFFLEQDRDLIFVLDDEAIVGRLDSFSYGLDADNPWKINYRFQGTMYPDSKFSLLNGYVGAAFNTIGAGGGFVAGNLANSIAEQLGVGGQLGSDVDVFEETFGVSSTELE